MKPTFGSRNRARIVVGALLLTWTTASTTLGREQGPLPQRGYPTTWAILLEVGASTPLTAPLTVAILLGAVLDDGAPF
jgi:hypothetical protein